MEYKKLLFVLILTFPNALSAFDLEDAQEKPIQLYKVEFKENTMGRYGPVATTSKGDPSAGSSAFAMATIFGPACNTAVTIESLDGKSKGGVKAADYDGSGAMGIQMQIQVPAEPFHFSFQGINCETNAPFQLTSKTFTPQKPSLLNKFKKFDTYKEPVTTVLNKIAVLDFNDEPLKSDTGETIGFKVRFSINFPQKVYRKVDAFAQPDKEMVAAFKQAWLGVDPRETFPSLNSLGEPFWMRPVFGSVSPVPKMQSSDPFRFLWLTNGLTMESGLYSFEIWLLPLLLHHTPTSASKGLLMDDPAVKPQPINRNSFCLVQPSQEKRRPTYERFQKLTQNYTYYLRLGSLNYKTTLKTKISPKDLLDGITKVGFQNCNDGFGYHD